MIAFKGTPPSAALEATFSKNKKTKAKGHPGSRLDSAEIAPPSTSSRQSTTSDAYFNKLERLEKGIVRISGKHAQYRTSVVDFHL